MNNNLFGYYYLIKDIDLKGASFTPIESSYSKAFTGTFEGNGHKVTNLTINNTSSDYQSLFGYVKYGTIKTLV